ncbi:MULTISPECIES: glycosyltransferase [Geobacter]|uniref:glycosyltransferase n=1 Tax=Geobacter TaxID=28231 RepID=UPI00257273A1|nr:glycosyltransferase [Geobacter sulfurreducens]
MDFQVLRGDHVGYFFAGRCYPFLTAPRCSRRQCGAISLFEIVNSPIMHLGDQGTFPPESELGEPVSENFFREAIEEFQPDVVHIQELAGLPFTLIDIVRGEYSLPVVMTLHNYFPLCPTLNLFTPDESFCKTDEVKPNCSACLNKQVDTEQLIARTLDFERRLWLRRAWSLWRRIARLFKNSVDSRATYNTISSVFSQRLISNIERLRSVDLLIAQSHRTREIYAERTGRSDIVILHSSLAHISTLHPRVIDTPREPIRFATLNGCASIFKGAKVLLEALKILHKNGFGDRFVMEIWGGIHSSVYSELISMPMVTYKGFYQRNHLDKILESPHVGIVPSICEEVYGYVGTEFLAKGIPVIGSRRGGITDYTFPQKSGWLNVSCSPEELAHIMESIILTPSCIPPLNRWIVENRSSLITELTLHANELSCLYDQHILKRRMSERKADDVS